MKFEILSRRRYNQKFGNFKELELDWEDIDEDIVDILLYAVYKESDSIKNHMVKGSAVLTSAGYIRVKTNNPKCPLCGDSYEEGMHAISIVDNETEICSECGTREQLERFTGNYDR